jgi:2-C-methyl-D-erythritol 4-phosphate cytidylyltransferase
VDGLLLKEKAGGKSIVSHSLDRFDEDGRCSEIIVLAAPAVREWISTDPLTFAGTKLKLVNAADGLAAALQLAREPVAVWQDGAQPNWQPALLDSLLRQWQPGAGVVAGEALSAPLALWSTGDGELLEDRSSVEEFFGGGKRQAGARPRHIEELVATSHLWQLQTPQVFDTAALRGALAAHPALPEPVEACRAAGMALLLIAARPHNLAVRDADGLHLLRRLLGEPKKGGKDRYGGLGW